MGKRNQTERSIPTLPAWVANVVDFAHTFPDSDARIALAIDLARHNVEHATGGPFGAAVFDEDGRVVAVGVNRVEPLQVSLAHAEIVALVCAQRKLGRARLNDDRRRYTFATSAQPCCQCYGAIVWAGIDELLIGARSEDTESLAGFDEGPLPGDWIGELTRRGIRVERDLRRDAACVVLAAYASRGGKHY
ncbi:MAG: nucleoside deaminase [Xanthomonadaceae bacterium]|nr:nucleoside deaminase [Xanthomonadaceae bacterium]MDE2053085.1 nucleoside deaminase [Xanthomonadaceae bacterium]MDE2223661.1 nucleoside deaminase [Xanthomonadaceae bacterium]MDE2498107.1 nucleoside deaminase [Xanthomonadaceae bacterium]